jgi:hypothetical protein
MLAACHRERDREGDGTAIFHAERAANTLRLDQETEYFETYTHKHTQTNKHTVSKQRDIII